MRRPTPLPADPNQQAASAEPEKAPEAPEAPGARPAREFVAPLRRPAKSPVVAPPSEEAPKAPEEKSPAPTTPEPPKPAALTPAKSVPEAEPAAADEVAPKAGMREVWRAARARRKVMRSEVRRFTVRARRRRIGLLVAAASMIVLVASTLAIAYSPLFAVEKIVIEGTVRLDAATLESAVSDQLGRPLPRVDESEIKGALVQFPMVESYQIEARPPHELLVRIVERAPIGVLQGPAGYSLVDSAGVVLSTTPEQPADAPLLQVAGGTDSAAFESVGLVMRALPDSIRVQVTGVTATTRDDVTLLLGDSRASVVWGSVEDTALKALVLETAMAQIPPAGVVSYDVSSPGAIVIR